MGITFTDCVVVGFGLLLFRWVHNRQSKIHHPPGPPGLPLIGNLRDLPKHPAWLTYRRWSQRYNSDLIRLNIFGSNIIVVNSLNTAIDLLEKRSAIYSDRPGMTMLNELCGYGWLLGFQRYGNSWRDGRRVFNQEFNSETVKKFRPIEEKATARFLKALLDRPHDLMSHLRHLAGSEIMNIAYAIDIKEKDDPYILTAEHAVGSISATMNAGSYLVDTLTFLKYLPERVPGASFQKEARMWRISVTKMLNAPYEVVKKRMGEGDMPECVATSLIEGIVKRSKDPSYMEYIVKCALGAMYTGGADTTVSALGSFFLAMVLYPEVQVKAQAEIDRVLDTNRLPSFSDNSSLPYVEAIVKESLRWNPVVPLAAPHRSTTDDIYAGYYLPKDTLVVANIWSILHDEQVYPDPLVFNPDRFMKDGKIDPDVLDPTVAAFGFGRRVCPGRHLAFDSIWIVIASTLAVCSISKAKNKDGIDITPREDYEMGFLCYPKPFPLCVSPRSAEHEVLVQESSTLD